MAGKEKLRGRQTVLPPWFLLELALALRGYKEKIEKTERWSSKKLGETLATLADRRLNGKLEPWDRKTVERFIDGDNPTEELVDAFILLFPHLVRPTYVARTREEALDLCRTASKYGNPEPAELTEQERRRDELRAKRAEIEADQTRRVESINVGRKSESRAAGGGRTRSVGRGRSSSSRS